MPEAIPEIIIEEPSPTLKICRRDVMCPENRDPTHLVFARTNLPPLTGRSKINKRIVFFNPNRLSDNALVKYNYYS